MATDHSYAARVCRAADAFVEGAFSPDSWPQVLQELSSAAGAAGLVLIPVEVNSRVPGIPFSPSVEELVKSYVTEGWCKIDVRAHGIPAMMRQGVITEEDILDDEAIRTNMYYQEYMIPHGFSWFAAIGFKSGSETRGASFQRNAAQGRFSAEEAAALRLAGTRFTTAATLAQKFSEAQLHGAANALELLGHAILIADRSGRILHANTAAERYLVKSPGRGCELAIYREPDRAKLMRHVRAAVRDSALGDANDLNPITISRPNQKPLIVRAIAIPSVFSNIFSTAAVIIVLVDPELAPHSPSQLLIDAFGLTNSEARIASLLAEGKSIGECADHFKLAISSARQLVKQAMSKTDTHTQSQLVTLVTNCKALSRRRV